MAKTAPKKTTEELYAWDAEKRQGGLLLCGVDEAGRGPLAGDVYAAAVILDPSRPLVAGLNDSKKMTEKKRDALFEEVKSACLAYCVASASVEEIETLNILGATMLAMQRAVAGFTIGRCYPLCCLPRGRALFGIASQHDGIGSVPN